MSAKTFISFVNETIGAITMERKPVDKLNEPENNVQQPKTIETGRAGSLPLHWNSPPGTLAGARYGANPREDHRVMTYKEFLEAHKKNTKKNNKS